jgi:hypothetical protein
MVWIVKRDAGYQLRGIDSDACQRGRQVRVLSVVLAGFHSVLSIRRCQRSQFANGG